MASILTATRPTFIILSLIFTFFTTAWPQKVIASANNLLITEVQISGGPGKTTFDFIELYNPTSKSIDIKGWRLVKRTANGATDQTIKSWGSSTIINPDCYYLWVNNDYTELTSFANNTTSISIADNNGIALRQGPADSGLIIDSLAWGKTNNGLGEGLLPNNPPALNSLERIKVNGQYQDTDNNAADFFLQTSPNPQSNQTGQTTSNTKSTNSTRSKTSNKIISATANKFVSLTEVKTLKSGEKITVEGVVTAAPDEISSNIMFLAGSGLQLNLTTTALLDIKRGQKIKVNGSVSQTKTYGTRLIVKSTEDIKILSEEDEPIPHKIDINYLTVEHEGWLVTATGQIIQRGSNWFVLENNDASLRINLKNKTHKWPKLATNERVNITGLVTLSQGELKLWPRLPDDIEIIKPQGNLATSNNIIDFSRPEPIDWRGYIILFLLAILLSGGWWWQKRKLPMPWQLLKDFIIKYIRR